MKLFTAARRRPPADRIRRAQARATLAEAVEPRLLFAAFAVSDASVLEGTATGSIRTPATFTVTLLQPLPGRSTTVDFATSPGSATSGTDFIPAAGTLNFAPGETAKSVQVQVVPDGVQEGAETFTLNLSNPTGGAGVADGIGRGTVVDDDASVLTAADTAVLETDGPSAAAVFTVTRSGALGGTSSVNYATGAGSAGAADFAATAGTLTFNPNESVKTITVPVVGDALQEANEFFNLNLSAPTNAALATPNVQAVIFDDDASAFAIADAFALEGAAGVTTNAAFTVTRTGSLYGAASVGYATRDVTSAGAPLAGADYTSTAGTLNFAPGQATATFVVPVLGDGAAEGVETTSVALSNPQNASLDSPNDVGQLIVLDDDSAAAPYLYADDAPVVTEGDAGTATATFTVRRAGPTAGTTTVNYATLSRSAISPNDFTPVGGTLTFAPGETAKTVPVPVVGDTRKESSETFFLNLQNPSNGVVCNLGGRGLIADDDNLSGLYINDVRIVEPDGGTTADAVFTVTRLGETNGTAQANWDVAFGTAGSSDVTDNSGIVDFAAGQATATITVQVKGDGAQEGNETFFVALINPGNAVVLENTGTGTVIDNDASVLVAEDAAAVESTSGTVNAVFTVRRFGSTAGSASVAYATADGTATHPADYAATSGTLSFAAGQTSRTISVPIVGDLVPEPNETFALNLSSPSNTSLATTSATGTIVVVDDDQSPRVLGVYVNGTAWTDAFRGALGAGTLGYSVPGAAAQLTTLPWANADQIRIRFEQNVRVDQADLTVRGTNVANYAITGFAYDPATFVATWTLGQPVGPDRLLLTLSSAAGTGVSSAASGDRLDGEWANGADSFPSGDGTTGGDFQFRLNVLPGDATRDGHNDSLDLAQVRNRNGRTAASPGTGTFAYSPFCDLDGDARINADDLYLWSMHRADVLPIAQPSVVESAASVASTRASAGTFTTRRISAWASLQEGTNG